MADIKSWLPFKFRRERGAEKPAPNRTPQATGLATTSPLMSMSPMMSQMMQSFFDEPFFREPMSRLGQLDRWFGDFSAASFTPSIDVVDEESHLRVSAELPGIDKKDIQLSIEDNVLSIRGEKKNVEESREAGCYRTERTYGFFQRSVPLPADVDSEKAEATFDKGVLTVRMPKAPKREEGGKRIEIKS